MLLEFIFILIKMLDWAISSYVDAHKILASVVCVMLTSHLI
jgi:hypothetical protein